MHINSASFNTMIVLLFSFVTATNAMDGNRTLEHTLRSSKAPLTHCLFILTTTENIKARKWLEQKLAQQRITQQLDKGKFISHLIAAVQMCYYHISNIQGALTHKEYYKRELRTIYPLLHDNFNIATPFNDANALDYALMGGLSKTFSLLYYITTGTYLNSDPLLLPYSLLHHHVEKGNVQALQQICEGNTEPPINLIPFINYPDHNRSTPLHIAVQHLIDATDTSGITKYQKICCLLIKYGAYSHISIPDKYTLDQFLIPENFQKNKTLVNLYLSVLSATKTICTTN